MFVIGFAETSRQLVNRCSELVVKRKSGICLPHKITKHWQIAKIIYGFLLSRWAISSARRKNIQNTDLSPMKSENALKTNNPPEEKFLKGIISLFLVINTLLILT